jgi:hypothetical protein
VKKVAREEILDYVTYNERREGIRAKVLEQKKPRRIHLGEHLTFLFENADTVRYQVQEMMRAEQIVKEAAIQHELDTYNGLLGDAGELGCTLLIEIADEAERSPKLRRWLELPQNIALVLEDGSKVPAQFDAAQVGEERLSSVQYLKFAVGEGTPVALGVSAPEELVGQVELTEPQREALLADLRS